MVTSEGVCEFKIGAVQVLPTRYHQMSVTNETRPFHFDVDHFSLC